MLKLKTVAAAAAMLATGAAYAGATANIGVGSEYLFRGIPQTNGATVQGGLDFSMDSGLYAGVWASNVNFAGAENGNEFDLYGGFTTKLGEIGLDVGAIGYLYTENAENGANAAGDIDFMEVYVGASAGPVSAKVYYSPDYNNNSKTSLYGTATASFPLSDTLSVFAQVGSLDWDDTDSYIDFSTGVTKSVDGGLSFTLGAYSTKGRGAATAPAFAGQDTDDEPKFVVSAKKTFDL